MALARAGVATAKAAAPLRTDAPGVATGGTRTCRRRHSCEASEALRLAEGQLDTSRGPDQESVWVRYLDHHYLQAEAALCFRDLGLAAQAERTASESLSANADRRRRQAISRWVLATAHPQQYVDEVVGTATEALDTLSTVHSERSIQALRDFRTRLEPRRHEPMVQEFERRSRAVLGAVA